MFQKFTLYEESIRTLWITACLGEGLRVPKHRCDREHFVSHVDLLPTLCDYAGVPAPADVRGASVRAIVEGRAGSWRDYAYIESNYWGRAVVSGCHKYVTEYVPRHAEDYVPPGPDPGRIGREQLFDLSTDPGETVNWASVPGQAEVLDRYRARLFDIEAALTRSRLEPGGSRGLLDGWGRKMRAVITGDQHEE